MWNGGFIEKDRRIYPFRACKCWACNYPYNRGVVSKLEPLKWFNSAWIGPGICEDVYTWGVVEWVFNHSVLEPGNSRAAHVEHWRATQYSVLIRDWSLDWAPPFVWVFLIFRFEISVCFIDWPHYCFWCWYWTTTSVCFLMLLSQITFKLIWFFFTVQHISRMKVRYQYRIVGSCTGWWV